LVDINDGNKANKSPKKQDNGSLSGEKAVEKHIVYILK
jgi:hypothetical protein